MVPSYFLGSIEIFYRNVALACTSRGEDNRTTKRVNHTAG